MGHNKVDFASGGDCQATKEDGSFCTRRARKGDIYCWQHSPSFKRKRNNLLTFGGFTTIALVLAFTVDLFEITDRLFPTQTPTPTQTYTVTPSPTVTLTPTPKPLSDFLYYMIVYDSSLKMNESFHGQEKWQVARNLIVDIINGLNPRAQYSLVAIGGSNPVNTIDPCDSPTDLTLRFTSRQSAYDFLGGLQPQGGGSFYKAYTLAKNQLENLPEGTIRTLIYITGTSDSCETHEEWEALKNLMAVPDSTFGLFSQIIILDEDGIRAQSLADQLNSLSNDNIDAQAPQSLSEIQGNGVTTIHIVNNVTNYVVTAIATISTPISNSTAPTFTNTVPPTFTLTAPPNFTRTYTPSITPSRTPSLTPSLTPIPPPVVILRSVTYIENGQPDGCDADVLFDVVGSSVTGNFHVWNASYPPEGDIYPSQTFPVENNQHRVVGLGGHGDPSFYPHEVWFVYNGISSSNRLTGLICPRYLTPTP